MMSIVRLIENEDYIILPVESENEQAWDVAITHEDYEGIVFRVGKLQVNGKTSRLSFDYKILELPEELEGQIKKDDLDEFVGLIVESALEKGILEDYIILRDIFTGEYI